MSKLVAGNFLELIPRKPPAATPGLVLVGQVLSVDAPYFGFEAVGSSRGWLYRADNDEDLAVRVFDRSLWEIGRAVTATQWHASSERPF